MGTVVWDFALPRFPPPNSPLSSNAARYTGVAFSKAGEGEGRRTMELARHAAQQLSELTIRGAGKLGANLYVQPEATVF